MYHGAEHCGIAHKVATLISPLVYNSSSSRLCLVHSHVKCVRQGTVGARPKAVGKRGDRKLPAASTIHQLRPQQLELNHEYLIDNITHPQALISLSRREPFLLALYSVSTRRCHGTGDK